MKKAYERIQTLNEHHISVKEKTASLTCIRKLNMSAYIFSASGVRTIVTGQSTLYPKPTKSKEWIPAFFTGLLLEKLTEGP